MLPTPIAHTVTRGPRLLLAAAGLCLLAGAALAAPRALPAPLTVLSSRDLGNRLCTPYRVYCSDEWRHLMAQGAPFNVAIAETCLRVHYYENDDAGIACLETAINSVAALPDSVLVAGQFAAGEREQNALWYNRSDRDWARMTTAYLVRVPRYCDEATPVIFDYFPCLLQEVRSYQWVLKKYRIQ